MTTTPRRRPRARTLQGHARDSRARGDPVPRTTTTQTPPQSTLSSATILHEDPAKLSLIIELAINLGAVIATDQATTRPPTWRNRA